MKRLVLDPCMRTEVRTQQSLNHVVKSCVVWWICDEVEGLESEGPEVARSCTRSARSLGVFVDKRFARRKRSKGVLGLPLEIFGECQSPRGSLRGNQRRGIERGRLVRSECEKSRAVDAVLPP